MQKTKCFHNLLLGISVLPALMIMPAMAETVTERQVIQANKTFTDNVSADGVKTEKSVYGGVLFNYTDIETIFEKDVSMTNNSNNWVAGAVSNGGTSAGIDGGTIEFNGNSEFVGNASTGSSAGAVYNNTNGKITFFGISNFTSNKALENGGALYNKGDIVFEAGAAFVSNVANKYGGAIENDGAGTITFNGQSMFSGNESILGGAIHNSGEILFNDLAVFTGNYTSNGQNGGIIYNSGKITFNNGLKTANNGLKTYNDGTGTVKVFSNNSIANIKAGEIKILGGDVDIANNFAKSGAGINNSASFIIGSAEKFLENVSFYNNETTSTGGAIYNGTGGNMVIYADNVTLTNNKTTAGYAGAIGNMSTSAVLAINGKNNTFDSNKSLGSVAGYKYGGGAVQNNQGTVVIGLADGSSINTFTNNESANNGGAILLREGGSLTINGTTTFENNGAAVNGGAIYSTNNGTKDSVLTLDGNVTFTGNTDSTGANDIYNDAVLNIANGTTSVDGGISGDGTLNIAGGATLSIGDNATVEQGSITLNGTMIANLTERKKAIVTAGTFGGYGKMSLIAKTGGKYEVFGDAVFDGEKKVTVESNLYDVVWQDGGKTVELSLKSVEDIAASNNLSENAANAVAGLAGSSSEVLNDLSVKMQEALASGSVADKRAVEDAANALNPELATVVQSTATSVQNTVSSLVAKRMALPVMGRSGGDIDLTSGGVWVQGLYNKTKMNGQFNSHTRGIAAGIDETLNRVFTVGAGYAFNRSDVSPDSRDIDIDSNTIFVYGQYRPSQWYANATLNYTISDYTEKGSVFGMAIDSDYNVISFGGQVMTGYDFAGGITPEIGLRYLHINAEDYANNLDIKNELKSADYLTAVLGTKYGMNIAVTNGMLLCPDVHYAIKYDLISDKSSVTVAMPGVAAYTLNGDRLSRIGGEFGIGVTMKYLGFDLSLNYDIDVRADYTSQTGMVRARYNF